MSFKFDLTHWPRRDNNPGGWKMAQISVVWSLIFQHLLPESCVAGHTPLSSQHVLLEPDSLKNKQTWKQSASYIYVSCVYERVCVRLCFLDYFQMSIFLTLHINYTQQTVRQVCEVRGLMGIICLQSCIFFFFLPLLSQLSASGSWGVTAVYTSCNLHTVIKTAPAVPPHEQMCEEGIKLLKLHYVEMNPSFLRSCDLPQEGRKQTFSTRQPQTLWKNVF